MSASGHETAANEHDQIADRVDGGARERCVGGRVTDVSADGACWTGGSGAEVDAHRRMAADHRAASQALRDAEAGACKGVGGPDRDESPFAHPDDIVAVEPLAVKVVPSKGASPRSDGVAVTLRSVSGLTIDYLEKLIACHLARNAAMGFTMSEMSFCPLAVKGATATVTRTTGGFRIEVRGDVDAAIQEITRRGNTLRSQHP